MTNTDARRILDWIDSALELFHHNKGHLTAREVRILSMIAVARQELASGLPGAPKSMSRTKDSDEK